MHILLIVLVMLLWVSRGDAQEQPLQLPPVVVLRGLPSRRLPLQTAYAARRRPAASWSASRAGPPWSTPARSASHAAPTCRTSWTSCPGC